MHSSLTGLVLWVVQLIKLKEEGTLIIVALRNL